jgi:hypothetical protein
MWCWLATLTPGQASFLGSVVGFIALVLGALVNFGLNRRRDAIIRREEADAVASALFGEVVLVRNELARTAFLTARKFMFEGEVDKHFMESIRLQNPLLYRALSSKLGLLEPQLLLAITTFYTRVEVVREWLPYLIPDAKRKYSHSVLYVLEPALDGIKDIEPQLLALAQKLKTKVPPLEWRLGDAEALAESERESWQQADDEEAEQVPEDVEVARRGNPA